MKPFHFDREVGKPAPPTSRPHFVTASDLLPQLGHKAPTAHKSTLPASSPDPSPTITNPGPQSPQKSTHKAPYLQKAPARSQEKAPARHLRKAPTNYKPVVLSVVVDAEELYQLILKKDQPAWATRLRVSGLLCLLSFLIKKHTKNGSRVSLELSHQYISPLKRQLSTDTIREPLHLLLSLGLIEVVQPYRSGPHCKVSSSYRLCQPYLAQKRTEPVPLPPKMILKLETASARQNKRLNSKYPFRAQLIDDLHEVGLAPETQDLVNRITETSPNLKSSLAQVMNTVIGQSDPWCKVAPSGQISTPFNSCLRELKPFLTISGCRVELCDISYAHWCLLPKLIVDRMAYLDSKGLSNPRFAQQEQELRELRHFLSTEDLYSSTLPQSTDPSARKKHKKHMLKLLNWKNQWTDKDPVYRALKARFPETFLILEDIKKNDHKRLSLQLQSWTANLIQDTLLRLQAHQIIAIPDTDCIICQEGLHEEACSILGKLAYTLTGVCCKVGGHRYDPSATVAA